MPSRTVRESLLQALPGPGGVQLHGWAREERDDRPDPTTCTVALETGPDGRVRSMRAGALDDALAPLVGTPSGSGFRRALGALSSGTEAADALRLACQLLDDLPIVHRVSFQTFVLDHPALPGPPTHLPLAGADQCEGWRSDGTMLRQVADQGGLRMRLTEVVDDTDGPFARTPVPPLPPLASRRRRLLRAQEESDGLHVLLDFRDSYADPDGVERSLHAYGVQVLVDPGGQVHEVEATGRVLPWPECWSAAGSASRLVGRDVADLGARRDLVGRGTCTHLSDTLQTLATLTRTG